MSKRRRAIVFIVATTFSAGAAAALSQTAAAAGSQFADADNRAAVILGKQTYAGHCAGCHGRNLQGQPLWQLADAYAGRRAPALDETGYSWQHSDEEIFKITKFGRLEPGPSTAMPAFEHKLDDSQILAIVAFIKARWPLALRILQARSNPGFAGMPADATNAAWQLPPNCNAVLQRSEAGAQSK
jgi:S-disulfanyl-L-cysteine oxidoreductase SoxD